MQGKFRLLPVAQVAGLGLPDLINQMYFLEISLFFRPKFNTELHLSFLSRSSCGPADSVTVSVRLSAE